MCRRHGASGLEAGPDAPQRRCCRPSGQRRLPTAREATRCMGGGPSQYPLEPGRLSLGRAVVHRTLGGQGPASRAAAAGLPERSDPYACVPLYAQTWLLAPASGMVVERLGPAVSQTRRLRFRPRCCNPSGGLSGGLQPPSRPSVSVDLYRATLSPSDTLQSDASSTTSGSSVGKRSTQEICTGLVSTQAL